MVIGVSTETIEETKTKQKAKKSKKKPEQKEETQPTPTPTPTLKEEATQQPTSQPKKAKEKTKKEAKEKAKETKEAKPETKPPTKPAPTRRPRIRTATWEEFEKFKPKTEPKRKSWIKEVIEKARKEPVKLTGLKRGQLLSLITQVNRYNRNGYPKIDIKYDTKRGIAILAPITTEYLQTK
jgi:hypothetical protein